MAGAQDSVKAVTLSAFLGLLIDKLSNEMWTHKTITIAARDAALSGAWERITLDFAFFIKSQSSPSFSSI